MWHKEHFGSDLFIFFNQWKRGQFNIYNYPHKERLCVHKSNSNHRHKIFAQDPSSMIQNFKCMQLQGNSPKGGGEECHKQQRTSECSWHSADSVSCQLWSWSQKKTAELLFFLNTSQTGSKAFDKLRRGLSCERPNKGHGLAALAQHWALQVTFFFLLVLLYFYL